MKFNTTFSSRQFKLSAIAATCVLIAGGFAGCGGSDYVPGPMGKVVDGYVSGASLLADMTGNDGICETDTGVKTNATGDFVLDSAYNGFTLCARGGTDIATGMPLDGELKAPAGATQITPLTTLVQAIIEADKAAGKTTTAVAAATTVSTNLGLGSTDILNTDPVAASVTNPDLGLTTIAIQVLLVQAANEVAKAATGLTASTEQTNALYSSAVAGVAKAVATATSTVDLTPTTSSTGATAFVSQAIENTVVSAQSNPTLATTVVGVANLTPSVVADTAVITVTDSITTAMATTTTTTTTTTTAAPTTTTAAPTTTTAAPTTTTAATTSTTAAPTTTTAVPTTTTAAATTTTTAAPTTTTAAPTTTTAAPTTTTTAAPTTTTTTTTATPTTTTTVATTTTTTVASFAGVCEVKVGSAIGYMTSVASATSCSANVINVDGGGATVAVAPATLLTGKTSVAFSAASICDPFGAPPSAGATTLTACKF